MQEGAVIGGGLLGTRGQLPGEQGREGRIILIITAGLPRT